MHKKFKMNKSAHVRYINKGFPPKCRNCGIPINVNDKCVNTTQWGRIAKSTPKLYCIPCAKILNII